MRPFPTACARRPANACASESPTYSRSTSTNGRSASSPADDLAKLADLKDRGVLTEEEFQHAKATALGTAAPSGGTAP
jgi:Short C-terminal domain